MSGGSPPWPVERSEALARLIGEGKTRNVIARELGVKTAAVVGRAQRMGLPVPPHDPRDRKVHDAWPAERVAELKRLWADGHSASQIVAAFDCGMTRSGVIGKVHRLKLPQRSQDSNNQASRAARAARSPKAPAVKRAPKSIGGGGPYMARRARNRPVPAAASQEPPAMPLISELTALCAHHCRWPIGDPQEPAFGFCGHPRAGEGPYCAGHDREAHQPFGARSPKTPAQLARSLRRFTDPAVAA